jgi:23S rRNA (guanosine2251-2'-O)-methyltransferase
MYIYGRNAVYEAVKTGAPLEKVFIQHSAQGKTTDQIRIIAKQQKIPVTVLDNKKFIDLEHRAVKKGENTQGILALRQMYQSTELEVLIDELDIKSNPLLVVLDGINDPHNFGAIVRSAECAGAKGIIRPIRNSAPITPAVLKTSAGALEHLPIVSVSNLSQTLDKLKEAGFWVFGTDMKAEKTYSDKIYDCPVVLIIGSEGKGMRPGIRKQCDNVINIPMYGKTESLNASVSAGIIIFEIARQHNEGKEEAPLTPPSHGADSRE